MSHRFPPMTGTGLANKAEATEDCGHALLTGFLDLLTNDMAAHPERLARVPEALVERGRALVEAVRVELGAELAARPRY